MNVTNSIIPINAEFLLAGYYYDKSKNEAKRGNLMLSKSYFALHKETAKKASGKLKVFMSDLAEKRKKRKTRSKIQSAIHQNRNYSGCWGWFRYKWQKLLLYCRLDQKEEKREGKLSLLAEEVKTNFKESSSSEDDMFNTDFTETILLETLPSPPLSKKKKNKKSDERNRDFVV